MQRLGFAFALLLGLSACAPGSKVLVTETPPPPAVETKSTTPPEKVMAGMAHVNMKGYSQPKALGLIHLVQNNGTVKAEIMMDGLLPGPYKIGLGPNTKCADFNIKHKKRIGSVIADSKGTIKAQFEISLGMKEILKKKIFLYTKVQDKKEIAACGVPELVENRD